MFMKLVAFAGLPLLPAHYVLANEPNLKKCTDDVGCSLNGACRGGHCACDPGWVGTTCNKLNLGPAALSNGYRRPGVSSWGGSVIRDGDKYHLFVEELVNGCGLNTYVRNMRIAHAVSNTAAGPYTPVNLVTNYSASTPHAVRDPATGDWLVFATGCGREACLAVTQCSNATTDNGADMSPCPDSDGGSRASKATASGRSRHAAPCKCPRAGHSIPGPECSVDWGTNVFRAPTADGPWTLTAPLLDVDKPKLLHADGTPVVFANPSALLLANGTAALMYRDFLQLLQFPATNVLGLAISHTGWRGPYTTFVGSSNGSCSSSMKACQIVPDYAEVPEARSVCMVWRSA